MFKQETSRSRRVPIPVLYDFIFERYKWTLYDLMEVPGPLFDELLQVWQALGDAHNPGPKVAATHQELLAQAHAQGFATTPEEYEREMGQSA